MGHPARDRVTVDLRGLGERLRVQAAARRMSSGAFVRRAITLQLDDQAADAAGEEIAPVGPVVKLTLRLPAAHAADLAARARSADVSQGAYVAGLLDGSPPAPLPADHADAIAALVGSTDQLAVMSADVNAFLRALRGRPSESLDRYRAGLLSLADDVRKHLAMAAELFREIRAFRPARAGRPAHRRAARG